jgi:hypothetical protein
MAGRGGQGGYKLGKTVIYEDDDEETEENTSDFSSSSSSSIPPPPISSFSEKKTQLRLDGLEPYVLVSAITATASFDVVTGGNLFENSPIFVATADNNNWDEAFRVLLLITSTTSSCLGLYSLGIFSFCIMYSKAALAREDEAHQVYQQFFDTTASYRYKGYQAFLWSLILFVIDLFLFAIAYLPESIRPFAALGSAPIIFTCWNDWQAIIKEASIIYAAPSPIQVDNDNGAEEEPIDSNTNGSEQ